MEVMDRMTFVTLTGIRNGSFYAAGVVGVLFGLGLMVAAVVRTRNQPASGPASPWASSFLIIAGQVVASAGGFAAVIPLMRRRQRTSRLAAGLCPSCGYDLRATPDACPECGAPVGPRGGP
jgi:hypothetical protein